MSNTAEDFQSLETTSTEGMESFFSQSVSVPVSESHENSQESHERTGPSCETEQEEMISLSVTEAVNLLGISRSTVYRHAQEGKLRTETPHDGKMRILVGRNEIPENSQDVLEIPEDSRETTDETACDSHETVEILNGNPNSHASIDVEGLLRKLESATYRIGYLEAQLESRDEKIKLLTDSQSKPTRWQQFISWFLGQ